MSSIVNSLKKANMLINELYRKNLQNTKKNRIKLEQLKDYCKDKKRCFIIGNGPSLTKQDMDLIKNEVTFVCNRFYKFYEDYEATVYFAQDPDVLGNNIKEINEAKAQFKMINPLTLLDGIRRKIRITGDAILFHAIRKLYWMKQPPKVSESFENGLYDGFTVTYSMIQAAILLGFQEIYLLGVDFNYVIKDGKIDNSSYPAEMAGSKGGNALPNLNYNYQAYKAEAE